MKQKITKGQIMRSHKYVIQIPYCKAQTLLSLYEPIGYNNGINGWNWDVYSFGRAAIVTGYRNLFGIKPNSKRLSIYEQKAYEIASSDLGSMKTDEINNVLYKFIREVIERD